MIDLFQKIKSQLELGYPFAVFCKPGSNSVTGIFQNNTKAHFLTDYSQKGFVFAPFDGDKICFVPEAESDMLSVELKTEGFVLCEIQQPEIDTNAKAAFEALVSKSVDAIKSGSFEKLVLSRTETVGMTDTIITVYSKLLAAYPMGYRYCFFHPESGLWMGATPEQLLKVENKTLHTVALAGTQLYKEAEQAVWENKEKEEQQFVTGYIVESVQPYTSDIRKTEPYTFRAGNIVHIKTDITAELKDSGSLQGIISALHPTPAVCGLPKQEAKAFLLENEGYDRQYYSGYLGELNIDIDSGKHKTDLFVNLRSMKVVGDTAHLFVGCGITKDSDPEKEFMETVNKSMTMRRAL